jgi:hypothetical protein
MTEVKVTGDVMGAEREVGTTEVKSKSNATWWQRGKCSMGRCQAAVKKKYADFCNDVGMHIGEVTFMVPSFLWATRTWRSASNREKKNV